MKSYKGYSRAQLIDILADYAVFTATVNNQHGGTLQNTNKGDYVGLYCHALYLPWIKSL